MTNKELLDFLKQDVDLAPFGFVARTYQMCMNYHTYKDGKYVVTPIDTIERLRELALEPYTLLREVNFGHRSLNHLRYLFRKSAGISNNNTDKSDLVFQISGELKQTLTYSAQVNNRTISEEIEYRLRRDLAIGKMF